MNHSGSPGMRAVDVWNVLISEVVTPLSMGITLLWETLVDDLKPIVMSGTNSDPENLYDNDVSSNSIFTLNEYVDIELVKPCRVTELRHHGITASNPNSRYRLQAYVGGVWVDALVNIADIDLTQWSAWLPVDTIRIANRWRFECTTFDTAATLRQVELKGIAFG